MSKLKLSERTVDVIKNFAKINPSLLFREGNAIKTKAPGNVQFGKAIVQETFPQEFAIFDLDRFISVLSMFNEPELKFGEKHVTIEEDNRKVNYIFSDEDNIVAAPKDDLKMPSGFVKFKLSAKDLQNLTKAQAIMGLPEILFVGKGGNISIETQDTKNPVSDVYTAKLGKSDKNFKVIVKSELITRLLQEDYEVEIAGNKTAAIIQFTGTDVLYHVAPEATSTYP